MDFPFTWRKNKMKNETPEQKILRARNAVNNIARAYVKEGAPGYLYQALVLAVHELEKLERVS